MLTAHVCQQSKSFGMQKFLTKSEVKVQSRSSSEIPKPNAVTAANDSIACGIDLSTCTAQSLIESTLHGVCPSDMMSTLSALQSLIQECSSYLTELVRVESKRLVIDSWYARFIFYITTNV